MLFAARRNPYDPAGKSFLTAARQGSSIASSSSALYSSEADPATSTYRHDSHSRRAVSDRNRFSSGSPRSLGSATVIKFGRTKSKSVDCMSSTACVAVAPAQAAGKVDVVATVAKAKSAVTAADGYTYG